MECRDDDRCERGTDDQHAAGAEEFQGAAERWSGEVVPGEVAGSPQDCQRVCLVLVQVGREDDQDGLLAAGTQSGQQRQCGSIPDGRSCQDQLGAAFGEGHRALGEIERLHLTSETKRRVVTHSFVDLGPAQLVRGDEEDSTRHRTSPC